MVIIVRVQCYLKFLYFSYTKLQLFVVKSLKKRGSKKLKFQSSIIILKKSLSHLQPSSTFAHDTSSIFLFALYSSRIKKLIKKFLSPLSKQIQKPQSRHCSEVGWEMRKSQMGSEKFYGNRRHLWTCCFWYFVAQQHEVAAWYF